MRIISCFIGSLYLPPKIFSTSDILKWVDTFQADRVRHLVAGASDRTVAPSGCTLGGCMGPMSRMLGLAADNVLGFTAVTADGRIVTMTTATMGSVEDNSGKVISTLLCKSHFTNMT